MLAHELPFQGRVLCAPLIVALLGSAAAYSGHHMGNVADLLARAGLMAAVMAILAHIAFRPVARFMASADAAVPMDRVRQLPTIAGLAALALTLVTIGSYVGHAHGSWAALFTGGRPLLAAMLAHVLLFGSYIGLFVYLILLDHMVEVRTELWRRRQLFVPAAAGRISSRIVLGAGAVAVAPLLVLLTNMAEGAPAGPGGHSAVSEALQMDLAAAALLTVVLVTVIARSVSRPVRMLLEAVERVNAGDFGTRVPVVSDDELGVLSARFNRMVKALGEREAVRRTFSRFVPEAVTDALIADQGAIAPQEREASILYADIEGFTRLASSLEPMQILTMLNEHFDEVARVLHAHGGVITQFQGDAVLASFNLPAPAADHAGRAVQAAQSICERLEARGPGHPIRMRIGVATGRVVGGTVGGGDRLGYTVHGDTVNLASRLEAMNKEFGSRILIDGFTADRVKDLFTLRDRGRVTVRGLAAAVRIYEVPLGGGD